MSKKSLFLICMFVFALLSQEIPPVNAVVLTEVSGTGFSVYIPTYNSLGFQSINMISNIIYINVISGNLNSATCNVRIYDDSTGFFTFTALESCSIHMYVDGIVLTFKRNGIMFDGLTSVSLGETVTLSWITESLPPPSSEPILKLHMDEGTGTIAYDSSGNEHDGTIINGTWVSGKFGSAVDFDGSSVGGNVITIIETWHSLDAGQGVCSDGTYLYTTNYGVLHKYLDESLIASVSIDPNFHVGGIYHRGGYIYVAVVNGTFLSPGESHILTYSASTLTLVNTSPELDEVGYGASCITYNEDNSHFYIGGAILAYRTFEYVNEYDASWVLIQTYNITMITNIDYGFNGISYLDGVFLLTDHDMHVWTTNSTFGLIERIYNTVIPNQQDCDFINATDFLLCEQNDGNVYQVRIVNVASYNGDNTYISIPYNFFGNLTEYTVTGWFKWDGGGGYTDGRKFIFESGAEGYGADLCILSNNQMGTYQKYTDHTEGAWSSTLTVSENTWYFFALKWRKGLEISLTLNGISYILDVPDNKMLHISSYWNVGTYRTADNRWFSGIIDDIRIFGEALSQQEITNIQNTKIVVVQDGVYGTAYPTGTFTEPAYYELSIMANPMNSSYTFSYWQVVGSNRLGQNPYSLIFTKNMVIYPVFKHVPGDTINPLLSFILPMVLLIGAAGFTIMLAKSRR